MTGLSEHRIPAGDFGDLAIDVAGVVHLALEAPGRAAIHVYRGAHGQRLIDHLPGDRVFDPARGWLTLALMPRIAASDDGRLGVSYQRGPAICVALLDLPQEQWPTWPETDAPFGVEMSAIAWHRGPGPPLGRWRVAGIVERGGRGGPILLVTVDYDTAGVEVWRDEQPTQSTQGISRIDADGRVWLVDEERTDPRWPDLHRPFVAGELVVGENLKGPERVLGFVSGGPRLEIFAGLARQPRAVRTAAGWTALAMGVGAARVVDLPPFVLDTWREEPPIEPPPPPPPPPVEPPKERQMYPIPRDIIAAGLAELRRIYAVHLRQALDDEGLAAWMFDVWVMAIYRGPEPGGAAGWQSRLQAANRAMQRAIARVVPNPPGEGWPEDPR